MDLDSIHLRLIAIGDVLLTVGGASIGGEGDGLVNHPNGIVVTNSRIRHRKKDLHFQIF